MKILTAIVRILVGCLFIFSGWIKANDPLGFGYKLVEYFEIFEKHIHFFHAFIPAATFLAVFICVFEMALGFTLLLGYRVKLTLWLLLLMIVFFTFLTFISAFFDIVKECGCFGDFLHLTPWTSFGKDVALLVFIVILFAGRQYINPIFGRKMEMALLVLLVGASTAFPIYTYSYLPIKDFRPYAVGKNIPEQMKGGVPDVLKYYYTLKLKSSGAVQEFDAWPTDWEKNYDLISNRFIVVTKGVEPKIKDFSIMNLNGDEYTDMIENPDYNFYLICYDLTLSNKEVFGKVNDFSALCKQENVKFVVLTSTGKDEIEKFQKETGSSNLEFYNTDGTVLKTMIRSNLGLIMLKAGVVQAMWPWRSFPSYNDVKEQYFKK